MFGKTLSIALGMSLLSLAYQAHASDDSWYLSPTLSHISPDGALDADSGWGMGLGLGRVLNERWNLELILRDHSVDLDAGGDIDQTSLGADGLYFFSRNPSFAPFALVGLGYMRTVIPGDRDHAYTANVGLGFLKQISDRVDFRADARYRWSDNDFAGYGKSNFGDWLINVGLDIALGPKARAVAAPMTAAPAPDAAPSDTDRDGVIDRIDICPGTPAGRMVDAKGCEFDSDGDGVLDGLDKCPGTPIGRAVNAEGCELDSDGDGVFDRIDACPGTPAGRTVDAKGCEIDGDGDGVVDGQDRCPGTPAKRTVNTEGCELDGDGDGVVDGLDQCPGTPKGDKVDNVGCTLPDTLVLKGVNFDLDSATIRPESKPVLDEAVEVMKRYPHVNVEISGHTDSTGSQPYNQELSEQRAKTVCDYFIQKGIEAQRLKSRGYGEAKPVTENSSEAGREDNRRVEMQLKDK